MGATTMRFDKETGPSSMGLNNRLMLISVRTAGVQVMEILFDVLSILRVSLLSNRSCFIVKTTVLTPQALTRCPRANV